MNISLRRGERIYINGAVFRVDRKVCIELLNDVTFLLENHAMQAVDANTPLRQLYFAIQLMLMSPNDTAAAMDLSRDMLASCKAASGERRICDGLAAVSGFIEDERYFEALKVLRALFPLEKELMTPSGTEGECAA